MEFHYQKQPKQPLNFNSNIKFRFRYDRISCLLLLMNAITNSMVNKLIKREIFLRLEALSYARLYERKLHLLASKSSIEVLNKIYSSIPEFKWNVDIELFFFGNLLQKIANYLYSYYSSLIYQPFQQIILLPI